MASSHIPYQVEDDSKVDPEIKYVGVLFDEYTPAVEAQILRDCLALLDVGRTKVNEVVICCNNDRIGAVLSGLGMRHIPTLELAKLWLVYKTGEYFPQAPDWSEETIERDLWIKPSKNKLQVLDDLHTNGFYLPPQGRLCPDSISLERPAPNGYVPVDNALFLIWGS